MVGIVCVVTIATDHGGGCAIAVEMAGNGGMVKGGMGEGSRREVSE